jgi:hypothetical protein
MPRDAFTLPKHLDIAVASALLDDLRTVLATATGPVILNAAKVETATAPGLQLLIIAGRQGVRMRSPSAALHSAAAALGLTALLPSEDAPEC